MMTAHEARSKSIENMNRILTDLDEKKKLEEARIVKKWKDDLLRAIDLNIEYSVNIGRTSCRYTVYSTKDPGDLLCGKDNFLRNSQFSNALIEVMDELESNQYTVKLIGEISQVNSFDEVYSIHRSVDSHDVILYISWS